MIKRPLRRWNINTSVKRNPSSLKALSPCCSINDARNNCISLLSIIKCESKTLKELLSIRLLIGRSCIPLFFAGIPDCCPHVEVISGILQGWILLFAPKNDTLFDRYFFALQFHSLYIVLEERMSLIPEKLVSWVVLQHSIKIVFSFCT